MSTVEYTPTLLAAVEILDRDAPGWHRKIDLETFNLADCERCVIGQAYAEAWQGNEAPFAVVVNFESTLDRFFGTKGGPMPASLCDVPAGYGAFWPGAGDFSAQWRSLIAERQAADEFTLAVNAERVDTIEGVPV